MSRYSEGKSDTFHLISEASLMLGFEVETIEGRVYRANTDPKVLESMNGNEYWYAMDPVPGEPGEITPKYAVVEDVKLGATRTAFIRGRRQLHDVHFKALHDQATLPSKAYADDAGFDLFACIDVTILPGTPTDVPTGVACELPEGTWGMIVGRSSTFRKRHLLVNMSVIDVGWRGDLFVNAVNLTQQPVEVKKGERIGQIIFLPNPGEWFNPVFTDSLAPHPRGENGFGSTGT